MDENNLGGQNPELDQNENTEQDDQSMLDKVIQNNPFLKFGQGNYQNVQTQSVVKSTREEANEQLAQINAHNAEVARQQKLAEEAAKAKRTGIYVAIGIFFAAILGAGIWLTANAIIAATQGGVQTGQEQEQDGPAQYGRVEGYRCKTEKCEKAADISEGNILIRDGSSHYLYDIAAKKASLTTIPEQEYHAITPLTWGEKTYFILDPESAQSALYSMTDNRIVTDFAYDEFFYDANAEQYAEMAWVEGKYIVAKSNGLYCLIQLSNGKETIRAAKRVFVHDDYYFGYESDGSIHIYADSAKKILVSKAGEILYTDGTHLIQIDSQNSYRLYDRSGEETEDEAIRNYFSDLDSDTMIPTLDGNSAYYRIPANK